MRIGVLLQDFLSVLETAGSSLLGPAAYDTAWVGRVSAAHDPQRSAFPRALHWLTLNQAPDGGWGEGGVAERMVATLAACIALTEKGNRLSDQEQVARGVRFIWQSLPAMHYLTVFPVGFELLLSSLVSEGQGLGLALPAWLHSRFADLRQQKLGLLRSAGPVFLRATSAIYSVEFLGTALPGIPEELVSANGSVGGSPAATSSVLRSITDPAVQARMLAYLTTTAQGDGPATGWSSLTNYDIFEIAWVLYNLQICGGFHDAMFAPMIQAHLDTIQAAWGSHGVSIATTFPIPDMDDSAIAYAVLRAAGRHVAPDAFESYWKGQHFVTFEVERDPSTSTNIHALEALKLVDRPDRVAQVLHFLSQARHDWPFWTDKWHVSPYYPTAHAILVLTTLAPTLIEPALQWLYHTQHADGSWGVGVGTQEETAYAVQAVIWYAQHIAWSPQARQSAAAGAAYLRRSYQPFHTSGPALWVGKNCYYPATVVRSAVLSALILAEHHQL